MVLDIPSAVSAARGDAPAGPAADEDSLPIGGESGFSTVRMAGVARRVVSMDWHRGDGHSGYEDSPAVRHDCELARGVLAVHDCGNLSGAEETARSVLGTAYARVETMAAFRVPK